MFLYVLRFMRAKIMQTREITKQKIIFFAFVFPSAAFSYEKIVQKNGLAKRMMTYFRLHPRNVLIFKQFKRRIQAESRLPEPVEPYFLQIIRAKRGLLRKSLYFCSKHFELSETHQPISAECTKIRKNEKESQTRHPMCTSRMATQERRPSRVAHYSKYDVQI